MRHNSLRQIGKILKQEGTSRQERFMQALHDNESLMDGRGVQDFIAYMQRYAENVLFVNADDGQSDLTENWEHFFENDILFLIANVASINAALNFS